MTLQTPLFLIVAAVAFGYSAKKFKVLFQLLKAHQGTAPKFGEFGRRVMDSIVYILGQKAVLNKKYIGVLHTMIFWGFILISFGTLEQFFTTIHHDLSFEFIGTLGYAFFKGLLDWATLFVLVAVVGAALRRYVVRPAHLEQTRDANIVLVFTGSLMVSIFLMEAFHIVGENPWYRDALPVSSWIGMHLIAPIGFKFQTAAVLAVVFKWVHMLLVMGFAMFIPNSKHLHIVAAGPNTFLRSLTRGKSLRGIDFANEAVTQYGAAKVTDLTWKDGLDLYSCTECGRCDEVCPAKNTGKPLSPKKLIHDLKLNLYANKENILAGKHDEVTPLVDGAQISEDVIWACTSCRACEINCPVFIQHTDKIFEARRNLVMMESKFPTEVQGVFKNMETNGAPWAFSAADRTAWAEGLEVKTMAEVGSADNIDVLLWVGCAGAFDDRNKKVMRSMVSLLKKADVKFAILGSEEQCTGDSARRIGNEYLYQTLAQGNIDTFKRYNVKKILTSCPHCFNTIKNEYKEMGGDYDVMHHSQFISKLVEDGRLKPTQPNETKIAFHDSCYMGRWNGVYEEPRAVLSAIPGTEVVEIGKAHHDQSMCCGAGGGRMWMEEHIGTRVNEVRANQALDTGANVIAASCPFCMTMMNDGVKAKNKQDSVKVLDIAELMDQST